MKKVFALLIAAVFLFCSCSGQTETPKMKTADMLDITNTDMDFQGCKSRLQSVLSAMKSKVTVLENAHNTTVKANAENEYFLEKDYVLTAFEPFLLSYFDITDKFNSELTEETAKSIFEIEANGMEILLDTDGETSFVLQLVSEIIVKEFSVEYSEKSDSFRYIYSIEDSNGVTTREFLEFIKEKDGVYLIQSSNSRCLIEFNDEDEIVLFCCGELSSGEFTLDESIFGSEEKNVSENWVLARGKSQYSNIHTYSDGVLTHEDCSSGPWKSIKINEADYASAFYARQ